MNGFFLTGAAERNTLNLPPQTRLECKICGYVYDPVYGDEAMHVPPGTAFSNLPLHWFCPECGNGKQDFLILDD